MNSIENINELFYKNYILANNINFEKIIHYPTPIDFKDYKKDDLDYDFQDDDSFFVRLYDGRKIKIHNIYVDVISGEISTSIKGFNISTMGENLTNEIYYNDSENSLNSLQYTKTKEIGLFGKTWVSKYETYCIYTSSEVILFYINGKKEIFSKHDYTWTNQNTNSLTKVYSEDFNKNEMTFIIEHEYFTFNFDGRLKEISDINKNSTYLKYIPNTFLIEEICTTCQKRLYFKYRDNKVIEIMDNINRSIKYIYENDFLVEIIGLNGGRYKLFYDDRHYKLKKIINPINNIEFEVVFNRYGEIIEFNDINEIKWQVVFDNRLKITSFKSINEYKEDVYYRYKFDRSNLIKEIECSKGKNLIYDYDSKNNLISKIEIVNKKRIRDIKYEYDEFNRVVKLSSAGDFYQTIEYNSFNYKAKISKSNGYDKIIDYDKLGNIIETREKINLGMVAVKRFMYDSKGRIIEKIDGNKNVTKFIYQDDFSVFPDKIQFANDFAVELFYDEVARKIKEVNLRIETKYIYNNDDLCMKKIYNNSVYEFSRYDLLGNLLEFVLPKEIKNSNDKNMVNRKFIYSYDKQNKLKNITTPAGEILKPYNISEVNKKDINNNENKKLVEYNYIGNIIEKRTLIKENEKYILTQFEYDKNLNLIQEKTSLDEVFIDEIPTSFHVKKYEYDNRNNLVDFKSNSGEHIKYFYIGINRLVKEVIKVNDSKSQIIAYEYNDLGLLKTKNEILDFEDADLSNISINTEDSSCLKIKTNFLYDENNNIIEIILPTNQSLRLEYDEDSKLIVSKENIFLHEYSTCENSKIKIINYLENKLNNCNENTIDIIDKHGRIVKKQYSDGKFEVYEYDCANNICMHINKNGEKTLFSYNSINKLKTIIDSVENTTTILYSLDYSQRSV